MKPVSAAGILAAGAFGESLGLLSRPAERKPGNRRQAVDKNIFVALEILEEAADGIEVRGRISGSWRKAFVGAANAAGDITRGWPIVNANGGDGQIEHSQIPSFDIDEQRLGGIQGAQQ